MQNFGGDKMDYYVNSALTVHRQPVDQSPRQISVDVDLANTAPSNGRPAYIFGPATDKHDAPGEYRGLVTVYLPPTSCLVGSRPDLTTTTPLPGTQNGNTAITFAVAIPPGGQSRVNLPVVLPPDTQPTSGFVLVPSPRVNPTTLRVTGS